MPSTAPRISLSPLSHPEPERSELPRDSRPCRLEPTLCCLCGIEDAIPIAVGEDFEYRTCPDTFLMVRCQRCGLLYLDPRPTEEELGRIYPDDYHAFQFDPSSFGLVYRVRQRIDLDRLRMWCGSLPKNARILDVGCGDGFHLHLLHRFSRPGWIMEGVDTDPRAINAAKRHGLAVLQGKIEDLDLPVESYDLILLIMTIEHVGDPLGLLRRVWQLLRPGGRVVIVTDNTDSPDFSIFQGRHWGGYHFPRHWNLFSQATLRLLAKRTDFHVEHLGTSFSPVNLVYSMRNLLVDWGFPRWWYDRFSLKSALTLAAGTIFDVLLNMVGRGAILFARFQKPRQKDEG